MNARAETKRNGGHIYIVGVGPGDPELLTLKAARIIEDADVIAYPTTESGAARAREIANRHIRDGQREYGFPLPMRADRAPGEAAYDVACRDLEAMLKAGKSVALLCEGDPFFYGSAMYLHARLQAKHPITVVPGVSAPNACAAEIGRPLAARNEVLKILPAPLDAGVLEKELKTADAAVIIKVGRHFQKVREVLKKLDLVDDSVIIESATGSGQRIEKLNAFSADGRPYFSTILVYKGGEAWR